MNDRDKCIQAAIIGALIALAMILVLFVVGCQTSCVRCEVELEQCRSDLIEEVDKRLEDDLKCMEIRNPIDE